MNELNRFIEAQTRDYATALDEIKAGRKRSHWMWYIFPQVAGLGKTDTSKHYAIRDVKEAEAFLLDPELGLKLVEICKALLQLETDDAHTIFGSPDNLKLHSSMTLFDAVPATFPVFSQVLAKFFGGKRDQRTLELLKQSR
ncbi:DUF1810 domain-containing protein [Mucilaginibacter conchicola]|uniref:DUF1810 domain-containing protein n=1 Tax=Mucilaginibacter conchicola TaxID=2303333 RepID=A0A372NUM5_9SPHI|nr:DUF1810 domain-containing protein [Mucilaginibacter conchicola]RFZ92915.1 DUF1810 domain-containing protein [Mucilaginibacter conchicola]